MLARWPVDVLRPEVSFQKAMQSRNEKRFFPLEQRSETKVVSNAALATVPMLVMVDEKAELGQVNVLYSFLENRYSQKVRKHI